eukprot:363291-Chlamydomonas_euryale.AAC.31
MARCCRQPSRSSKCAGVHARTDEHNRESCSTGDDVCISRGGASPPPPHTPHHQQLIQNIHVGLGHGWLFSSSTPGAFHQDSQKHQPPTPKKARVSRLSRYVLERGVEPCTHV